MTALLSVPSCSSFPSLFSSSSPSSSACASFNPCRPFRSRSLRTRPSPLENNGEVKSSSKKRISWRAYSQSDGGGGGKAGPLSSAEKNVDRGLVFDVEQMRAWLYFFSPSVWRWTNNFLHPWPSDGGGGAAGPLPDSAPKKGKGSVVKKRRKKKTEKEKEKQVNDGEKFQVASFLNSVVEVYCTYTEPDYSLPWQKQRQYIITGSAFMIGDGKLLTNAHCIEHGTQVKLKRREDGKKFVAKVLATGIECDLALLSVESEEFWKGAKPVRLGCLPCLQDAVTVVGYPLGGDTISITKGVVSRIEVHLYTHGTSHLLCIQIDAAINYGNSGGPVFNDQGECIGVSFQGCSRAENIGYVIPTTVVSHFLDDYERNGRYTGFPCLGVLLQKLESPALRAYLKVPSDEGVLVRRVEPVSAANNVLKEGDVIVSFDGIHVESEGTVPFRSTEQIAISYLITQKFSGDVVELGIIREGAYMTFQTTLHPRVHLVPHKIEGGQPSYLIIAGLVFTQLSEPLIEDYDEDSFGLKLLGKARYSLAKFKGQEIVIVTQVLPNKVNIGYEAIDKQQVLKFNGTRIKNIRHLAHLVDSCKDEYLVFEFEENFLAVLDREAAVTATPQILKDNGIPCERSSNLLEPFVDSLENQAVDEDIGASPVSNVEIRSDGLIWA